MLKVCVTLKGWMGKTLFPQWFARPHSCKGDPQGRQKFVWVDHCSSHVESLELTRIWQQQTPPCTTQFCQPANVFVISKINMLGLRNGRKKKMELIQ